MSLAWAQQPAWLLINILVAYRLTRLWIDDMIPPLPRLRKWIDSRSAWWSLQYGQLGRFDRRHPGELTEAERDRREQIISIAERRISLYHGEPAAGYLITCYWCSGFWIALAVVLAASLVPATVWALIALPLALSATTGLIANTKGGKP